RVLVCVNLLFLLGVSSYAQNSSSTTSTTGSEPAATGSHLDSSTGAASDRTRAQDQAKPLSDNDADNRPAEHRTRVRLGGVAVSAGYSNFFPGFYPYDLFYYPLIAMWWNPYWGFYRPFPPDYFSSGSGKGELKLSGLPKNASVYVNGGYAGTADHLKSFWLDPGVYDLEVSVPDGERYKQRLYVLTGKTLHIDPKGMTTIKEGEQL
ncbi:MAG TPA: hypothetical protein VJS37_15195, partial [Terriglobales bacterium]|nr:hypothetical protein [Terriglobales bacterium]